MRTFNIESRYIHMKDAVVTVSQYADGSVALIAEDDDEEGFPNRETLSVNLSAYSLDPDPGHVYVPTWSENEGLPDALETAGIATPVRRIMFGPFNTEVVLMKLTEEVSGG